MPSALNTDLCPCREKKSLLFVLLLPLAFGAFGPAAFAATPLIADYMSCARALGTAMNERFTVVPGSRGADKGLFLYTDQNAFFLPLGQPQDEDDIGFNFFLKTSISNVGDIFLFFREKKPGVKTNNPSEIGYETKTPPAHIRSAYRTTPAVLSQGDYALDVFSRAIREKVMRVKYFIDGKNYFSTPREAKLAFEQDRANFMFKLAHCSLEGDRDLSRTVAEEMNKLETGLPPVTVWEKQIGNKAPRPPLPSPIKY